MPKIAEVLGKKSGGMGGLGALLGGGKPEAGMAGSESDSEPMMANTEEVDAMKMFRSAKTPEQMVEAMKTFLEACYPEVFSS